MAVATDSSPKVAPNVPLLQKGLKKLRLKTEYYFDFTCKSVVEIL